MPNTTQVAAFTPAMKVNSGTPKATEMHLWKGTTTWQVNGKRLVAAVSADRTWFWVRFEGRDEPLPPELHARMVNAGFYWGKKPRNLGYFGDSTPAKVALLRELGYHQAHVIEEPVVAPPAKVNGNVEHPAKVEPKGTTTSTPTGKTIAQTGKHYVAYNSTGRPVWADTGYFVSAAELVAMGIKRVDPKPDTQEATAAIHDATLFDAMDDASDPSDAYQFGFEMGRHDRDNGTSSKDVWLQGYEAGLAPDPVAVAHAAEVNTLQQEVMTVASMLEGLLARIEALKAK